MVDTAYSVPPEVGRYQQRALIVGVVFLVLLVIGAFLSPAQFFHSYLLAYVFWIGIALGCLALLMLQHVTGGAWGLVIRRVLESGTRTLPLMLLLFVPLIFGMNYLYEEWIHPEHIHEPAIREIVQKKTGYLKVWFFLVRTAIYFVIWIGLAYILNKWSAEQDRTANRQLGRRMQMLSGPGLVFFVLSVTFAAIDWVMSLAPEWFSTIFGLLFVAGWTLSAFAFVITVMVLLSNRNPMSGVLGPPHFHDLGKLLLAFVMVWAYFSFSQYLIIWSGNISEETHWYIYRQHGIWGVIALLLIIFHFALPFLLLLSRDIKRNARLLAMVAAVVLVMRLVDLYWLIAPEFYSKGINLSVAWMDLVAPIGLGGIWLWFFAWQLKKRPLMPFNDPYLEHAIEHGHRHH